MIKKPVHKHEQQNSKTPHRTSINKINKILVIKATFKLRHYLTLDFDNFTEFITFVNEVMII
jgi:hypothetical protein